MEFCNFLRNSLDRNFLESSGKMIFFSKSGQYWIDLNRGCISDAIHVYCDFTGGGRTCLQSNSSDVSYSISLYLCFLPSKQNLMLPDFVTGL